MRRPIIPYNRILKARARALRNHSTRSEISLWKRLQGRQVRGYDFHRQKPLGQYIVDFFCNELFLAIEIDGSYHIGRETEDRERQLRLESLGVHFLRFKVTEVEQNINAVIATIEHWIDSRQID